MSLKITGLLRIGLLSFILCLLSIAVIACDSEEMVVEIRPIVFVHGSFGSGAQFESQAMRFASNDYPANYIAVHEYDSTVARGNHEAFREGTLSAENNKAMQDRFAALDQLIDDLLEETGTSQVDLLGHSLGTMEMIFYLESSPQRAEKVAHYVNIDGLPLDRLPGDVSTLALWAGIETVTLDVDISREIKGAINVIIPDQTHVEVATSAETFEEIYRFFTGEEPETTIIIAEKEVELAGRALFFPENRAVVGNTVEAYKINSDTGARINEEPEASFKLDEDGAWGPFAAEGGASYELVLYHDGGIEHHFYFEPLIRSNYLVRLLTSPPGGGVAALLDRSDNHSNLVIMRNKEFLGDRENGDDALTINGSNIVNEKTCPATNMTIAFFVYDLDADGESRPEEPIAMFHAMSFFTGLDIFTPAADPPDSTISLEVKSRGGNQSQVINAPNWISSTNSMTFQFNDFVQ